MSDVETYEELDAKLTGISNRRDASKLWVGCYTYTQKDSLHSDWPLHLWAVSQMVPNLFASAHADIFISKVKVADCTTPQCKFITEDVFRNATIIHTADMTQPSQYALSKQSVHTGKTNTRQDISVGYFVQPGYAQDTVDASQVECVEPSLLPSICSPCLAAIEQCADNTGNVDRHICLHRQLGACSHSRRATSES